MTEKKDPPLDARAELPEDVRRKLDALDGQLRTIDHYAILGLARSATRAQVRSAFLAAAPAFHPDRYFGKKLVAEYAAKMQRVFARMALAHDTLLDDAKRAQYDRTLPPPLPGAGPASAPTSAPASSPPPQSSPREKTASANPPRHQSSGAVRVPSSPEIERARAQAFATRLAGGSSRMRAATPAQAAPGYGKAGGPGGIGVHRPSSPTMPAVDSKAAGEALRRRYEESKAHARTKQSSQELQAAEAASARGDYVEAARLYRIAVEHTADPKVKAAFAYAEQKAKEQSRTTAIEYAKSAEEKQDFTEAAIGWARAFDAMPSAETANRAALCFRRAGNDFRRAAKYGEEAVKMEPNKAPYHVTLALVYADAGLVLRARGEIERAIVLDPNGASVKEAAAKIKALR